MSTSVFGAIRDDITTRVAAIVPTLDPAQRWRHVPDGRPAGDGGLSSRQFSTREIQPREHTGVAGGGEREEVWAVVLSVQYAAEAATTDRIAADHVDLISALQPSSTYPSGLRVRAIEIPEIERDEISGRISCRWPVRCTYRYAVSLV